MPLASFIAAILSSRDHPSLVLNSLQMVELLLNKLPQVYRSSLRREGVMWEIDDIAAHETRSVKVKKEEDGKARQEAKEPLSLPGFSTTSSDQAAQAAGDRSADSLGSTASAGLARLLAKTSGSDGAIGAERASSAAVPALSGLFSASKTAVPTAVEAEDANIWRARALRERFAHEAAAATGSDTAIEALDEIKSLVSALDAEAENDKTAARSTVERIAALFTKRDDPVSSFELLRSGLVEGLYSFATKGSDVLPLEERRALLLDVFMVDDNSSTSAFTVLVRRLQESLSRLENVEITTAISSGTEETRRSPTSLMGRQLRLRLVAEDSTDIPRSCTNIVVSIHAIATFQNLDEYLRPKLAASAAAAAGGSSSAASRLSGVLAAFAAATGGLSGALPGSSATGTSRALSALAAEASTSGNEKSKDDSTSGSAAQESNHDSGKASGSTAPRRSSRLSGKGIDAEDIADTEAEPAHPDEKSGSPSHSPKGKAPDTSAESSDLPEGSDEAMARRLVEGLLQEGMDDDQFSEEEYDEEIFEDDLPEGPTGAGPDVSRAEDKTINVDVASDGSKVEAKTPDGTRVATPSNDAGAGSPSQRAAAGSSRPSYAAALQKKPTDWHLEFSMGETSLPLDTTIYGAVHKLETRSSQVSQRYIWSNVYTVKFKKVAGPAQTASESITVLNFERVVLIVVLTLQSSAFRAGDKATPEPLDTDSATVTLPASVPPGAPYAKLLQLLRVLHDLNSEWREFRPPYASDNKAVALGEAAFVNNKLTAKLNRQLEEPMIVASSCLPDWSKELPRYFPFLFPFETRYSFLQSTSFGYARLINKWQSLHSRQQGSTSRHDDSFGFLARLPRQKVRISRARLLESAFKVFELYGSSSSLLEVEYYEEVGTGLGPTLEFYSLVSKEFARKNLDVWRNDGSSDNEYVFSPTGLFPAPIVDKDLVTEAGRKRLNTFKTLGQFVAKALLDSRIIDCNFSPIFMKLVLNQPVPTTLASLKIVDATLAQSLESLQKMDASDIHELGLDFTLPGFTEIELHANGKDEMVTAASLDLYIREVVEMTLLHGVKPFVRAFRQGFNTIFPISAMSSFTADELVMLFGNTNEDWSESTLVGSIKPDHGLNADSPTFKDIVAIMASFSVAERRDFLQWLTGSPKLPIGGFGGLHPQLTIVKRPHESPLVPDDYLPSVMTCVNYLKMPLYSTRDVMRTRLEKAMREGSTSFHLS